MTCKHGMIEQYCAICQGTSFQQKRETHKREISEAREAYLQCKAKFRNFNEIWTQDEIYTVYERFGSLPKKEYKREIYKIAVQLERTTNAIKWMIKHIFSDRADLHRGREVIAFRSSLKK